MPAIILSIAAAFSAMKGADSESPQCGTEQETAVPATTRAAAAANSSVERHRNLGASSMSCLLAEHPLARCLSSGLTNKIGYYGAKTRVMVFQSYPFRDLTVLSHRYLVPLCQ